MALEGKQFGHYRVLRLIGKGGMGEVYLVEDLQIQRQVAAKVIRVESIQSGLGSDSDMLRLFRREATTIARLDHPHILPLHDYGEVVLDGEQVTYLIMPYRPEGSLMVWLRNRGQAQPTRHLTLKQVGHVILQAGEALQYAHDQRVMHLDVKPANFLIRSRSGAEEYPDLLLSDFGIARLSGATSSASQNVRGTPTYMAPEQCVSKPVFASDQYALAIMAYELLTGTPPFQGPPMNVMFAHLQEQPQPVRDRNPSVPEAIERVVQRALAKKPEERFPSVEAFARAFQQALYTSDQATIIRVLPSSPSTPLLQMPSGPSTGDIRTTLVISAEEARGGAVRMLTLASGRAVRVQIPAGAQSGQVLTLVRQGEVPGPGTMAGHLYLTLSVVEKPTQAATATNDALLTYRSPRPEQASVPVRTAMPAQEKSTFLPPAAPARPKRQFSPALVVVVVVLVLLLLGGGSLAMYSVVASKRPQSTNTSAPSIWHTQNAGTTQFFEGIVWSGSQFVVVGANGTILTSPDGRTWTTQSAGTPQTLYAVASSGSQFVAVGWNGTILTSPDGRTWTAQGAETPQYLNAIAWLGSQFVVVGWNGTILTSPDGRTWTVQNTGTLQTLYAVTWSGSQFVVVGANGTILTSPDGHTWTAQNTGTLQTLYAVVASSGSQFVVVGASGTILTSPDGSTWTSQNVGAVQTLVGVASSGSRFVVVGENGTILTSP